MHSLNLITHWNESEPVHTTTASILYSIRKDDLNDGLLFDSVTMADVLEDTQAINTLDALVVPYNQMDKKITQMKKAMNRAVTAVRVLQFTVSDPFKQKGITQVAAVFELTDGQSVTVYFHNPDRTPNKLTPTDEMVSWKWLLNKKDITIIVAPEQGKELNPLIVGQRIMMLAEKNSPAFVRRNGDKMARLARVEAIKNEVGQLQNELTQAQQDLADIISGKHNAPVVMPETGNAVADSEPVSASGVNYQELDIGAYSPNESLNKALQATGGNLIESAKAVFKDVLQGHYINTKIGKVLMMGASWQKLKQNLPTNTLKAKTIPFIPEILMGGTVTASDLYKDRSDGFIKFHQFEKDVELDNMTVTARLKVGEKADHQLVYHLDATEAALDAVETKKPDEAGKSLLSGFLALDNAELESIIADDSDGINLIIVKVVKKEAPTVITGKELGDFPDTEEGKKARINAVFDYYMNNFVEGMPNGIYSNALATNVRFDKVGAKKTKSFSGNPKKAKLVVALDKIIAQGEKTGQATATAKALASGVIMAHFLKHDVMLGEEKLTVRVVIHERKDGTFSYDHDIDREEYKAMGGSSGALDSVDSTENNLSVLQHNEPSLWHNLDNSILDNTFDSVNSRMVLNLFIEGEEPEYLDDDEEGDDLELDPTKLKPMSEIIAEAQAELDAKASDDDKNIAEILSDFEQGKYSHQQSTDPYSGKRNDNVSNYAKAVKTLLEGDLSKVKAPVSVRERIDLDKVDETITLQPLKVPTPSKVKTGKDALDALMGLVDKKDIRGYLRGVCIDKPNDVMVVTNGHTMTVVKGINDEIHDLIPDDAPEDNEHRVIVGVDGKGVSGRFPEWQRVMPSEINDDLIFTVNTKKLLSHAAAVVKATKLTNRSRFGIPTIFVGSESDESFLSAINSKYVVDMAKTFLKFGYTSFSIRFREQASVGQAVKAISDDGKVTVVVIPMRVNDADIQAFSPFDLSTAALDSVSDDDYFNDEDEDGFDDENQGSLFDDEPLVFDSVNTNLGKFIAVNGNINLGIIDVEGLESAPIRLEEGHDGAGLMHAINEHETQLKNAGFKGVKEFVYYVAQNFTEVRHGNKQNRIMIDIPRNKKGDMLVVELERSNAGSYYKVITAMIQRMGSINKNKLVAEVDRAGQLAGNSISPSFNSNSDKAKTVSSAPDDDATNNKHTSKQLDNASDNELLA